MENMPQKTWIECCRMAIKDIDKFELIMSDSSHVDNNDRIINPFTLSTWHVIFRHNNDTFPNPYYTYTTLLLPSLLNANPDLVENIIQYSKENLSTLSMELMYNYLHDDAIPKIVKERQKELKDEKYSKEQLLKEHGLKCVCMQTVLN